MQFLLKIFLLCILFIPRSLTAQDKNEELINWNSHRKLTWNDYKATPDASSDAAASTTTYLSIEYRMSNKDFHYKIESRFSKTRSWGLHKTAYILSHEQGHFDIAEIFARKLHKEMSAYKFDRYRYEKDLSRIYNGVLKEKEAMQNDYDRETRHSINKEKQAEWLVKIEKMLEEYEGFAGY